MPNEKNPQPIGGPEPLEGEIGFGFVPVLTVVVGGMLACAALMVTPARARGASHSAKLKWQERQTQVDNIIALETSRDVTRAVLPANDDRE
jgi:hypothetical protein